MVQLKSKFDNVSQENIIQKLTEMNYFVHQKTIVQEIISAAKVLY